MSRTGPSTARLLLADHEAEFVEAAARALSRRGFAVRCASSREELWSGLLVEPVEVLALEPNMPDSDGTELFREVRLRFPKLPIVVVTGGPSIPQAKVLSREGAYAYLTKPCSIEELSEILHQASGMPTSLCARKVEAPRVLVVHDEQEVLERVSRRLTECGMRVSLAPGAGQAIAKINRPTDFDVVLLRVTLPGMSGLDVLRHLQRWHPNTRVLLLTSEADESVAWEPCRRGAAGAVRLPLDIDEVERVVKETLARDP